ncbi:MAG: DUF4421 family protein [Reichenbachiella sp.]
MKKFLPIIFLLFSFLSYSQSDSTIHLHPKRDRKDSIRLTRFHDFTELLSLKLFGVRKSNMIAHYDGQSKKSIEYQPNESFNIGLGFTYHWLGLDVAFSLPFINNDDDVFGETSRFDFQSNIYMENFVVDLNIQSYKGFYNANPQVPFPGYSVDDLGYPIRPDIQTNNIGISAFYIFNHHKFSYRSVFTFNERQLKSAGSFLAGAYAGVFHMDADYPLIEEGAEGFDTSVDFRDVSHLSFGLSAGYAHTFILWKHLYISMTIAIGFGPQTQRRDETPELPEYNENDAGAFVVTRLGLGHNGETYFYGISAVNSFAGAQDENVSALQRQVGNFKIFVGHRFNPPKFLKSKKNR